MRGARAFVAWTDLAHHPLQRSTVQPGDRIGDRFELVRELGSGGMGTVWEATQLNLGRNVALKLLHPRVANKPEARPRFEREARVSSRLRHPHAIQVYDFGHADEHLYLAMELLRGGTLRAIVDLHLPVQPLERVLKILGQVSEAVYAAHELGLVHRDLKPENIFVERNADGDDRAVVVDFGLAFIEGGGEQTGRMTREGVAIGTPDYMSPEQVQGDASIGPPSDVYSLGCILYEMLTGAVPFGGDGSMHVLTQHLFAAPARPSEVRQDLRIPHEFEDLCLRMLGKEPETRPSMDTVRSVLTQRDQRPVRHERGRGTAPLYGRAARMISTVDATRSATLYGTIPQAETTPAEVGILGRISGDLLLGLGANSIVAFVVQEDADLAGAEAVYASHASIERIQELTALGIPVLTDVDRGDLERMTGLLRAGATEIVHRPVTAAELARRLWRAIRRRRRQQSRSEGVG